MREDLRGKDIDGTSGHTGVIVYGLLDCEPCREAEAFLGERSVPHKYVILEWQKPETRQALKKQFFSQYGGAQPIYPVLEYQGSLYFGFSAQRWTEILSLESTPEQRQP